MLTKFLAGNSLKKDNQQQQRPHIKTQSFTSSATTSHFVNPSFSSLKPPSSVLDEADTRNLLYGTSAKIQPSPLALLNPATDIRVVILTDVSFCHNALYDTNQPAVKLPSLQKLQDVVFGSSPIVYSGPVTKFHPFPVDHNADCNKQKWMVSRIFRLEEQLGPEQRFGLSESEPNRAMYFKDRSENSNSSDTFRRRMVIQRDFNSSNSPPRQFPQHPHDLDITSFNRTNHINNSESNILHSCTADYNCAIVCTFIANSNDHACLTKHWPELLAALDQLQKSVHMKLSCVLPLNFRELTFDNRYNRLALQLNNSNAFKSEIEAFKHRLLSAARIPRVICGQDKWPELLKEIKWAYYHLGSRFIAKIITAFVKFNYELLSVDQRSVDAACLVRNSLTRTVIVGDRVSSRRIVFILSMLIQDSFPKMGLSNCKKIRGKSSHYSLPKSNSRSSISQQPHPKQYFIRCPSFGSDRSAAGGACSTAGFGRSQSFLRQDRTGAWEIPKPNEPQVGESPNIYTMSHAVRPSFSSSYQSSSSLSSLAMASLLNNSCVNGASTSLSNSTHDNTPSRGHDNGSGTSNNYSLTTNRGPTSRANTFSASSFFQSLWSSPRTKRMNSAVSIDDFQFDVEDMERRQTAARGQSLGFNKMVDCEHFSEIAAPQAPGSLTTEDGAVLINTTVANPQEVRMAATLPTPWFSQSELAFFPRFNRLDSFDSQISPTNTAANHSQLFKLKTVPKHCIDVPELEDDSEDYCAVLDDDDEYDSNIDTGNDRLKQIDKNDNYDDGQIDLTVVLPLVTGYTSEFHPDFFLQGCPPSHELYTSIIDTMRQEEDCAADTMATTSHTPCTIIANLAGGLSASSSSSFLGSSNSNGGETASGKPDFLILNSRKLGITDTEINAVELALESIVVRDDIDELSNAYRTRFNLH